MRSQGTGGWHPAGSGWRCLRCGWEWRSRKEGYYPKCCAKCKTCYWDVERHSLRGAEAGSAATPDAATSARS